MFFGIEFFVSLSAYIINDESERLAKSMSSSKSVRNSKDNF